MSKEMRQAKRKINFFYLWVEKRRPGFIVEVRDQWKAMQGLFDE